MLHRCLTQFLTFRLEWKMKLGQPTSLKVRIQTVQPLCDMILSYLKSWLPHFKSSNKIWRQQRKESKFDPPVAFWLKYLETVKFRIHRRILRRPAACQHFCFNCYASFKSLQITKKFLRSRATYWIVFLKSAKFFTLSQLGLTQASWREWFHYLVHFLRSLLAEMPSCQQSKRLECLLIKQLSLPLKASRFTKKLSIKTMIQSCAPYY